MENEGAENETLEFLCKASKLVPNALLRCHYLSRCLSISKTEKLGLPSSLSSLSTCCKFCSNVFLSGTVHVSLMPKRNPGRKMKKIIKKSKKHPEFLRPMERKLLEICKSDKENKLIIKCLVCKKKSFKWLRKRAKQDSANEFDRMEMPNPEIKLKKKKKRKKKDIYAGLCRSVVSGIAKKSQIFKGRSSAKKKKADTLAITVKSQTKPQQEISKKKSKKPLLPEVPATFAGKQIQKQREKRNAELKESAMKMKNSNVFKKLLNKHIFPKQSTPSLRQFFDSLKQ